MLSKLKAYLLGQKLDLGHGKERQIATRLIGIRNDHKARYDLVKKRIESTKIYSKILPLLILSTKELINKSSLFDPTEDIVPPKI